MQTLRQVFPDANPRTLSKSLGRARNKKPKKPKDPITEPRRSGEIKPVDIQVKAPTKNNLIDEINSANSNHPQYGGSSHPSPPSFNAISPKNMMKRLAYNGNFNACKFMMENEHMFGIPKDLPTWKRPFKLNPRQREIIDAICDDSTRIILIEGDRRTGKSTSVWVAICECIWVGNRIKWGMWAATEKTCNDIHKDVYADGITFDYTYPLTMGHSAKKTRFINNGVIETHATKMSDSSGLQYQGIWIDEFHQVIKDNPDAFATIAAITRSESNLKIVMSCNMGAGAYRLLKEELFAEDMQDIVKFFTLLKEDVTHITEEGDKISRVLMRASMGKSFEQAQLDNIADQSGDVFPSHKIQTAIKTYPDWMLASGFMDPFMGFRDKVVNKVRIGVDPGFAHATGVFALGYHNEHAFELESKMLYGEETSDERIKETVLQMARQWQSRGTRDLIIVCESNSGAKHWMKYWRAEGFHCKESNFGSDSKFEESRAHYMRDLKNLLEQERFHFQSTDLRNQLLIYDPTKNKLDAKGDLADACLHAVHNAVKKGVSMSFVN